MKRGIFLPAGDNKILNVQQHPDLYENFTRSYRINMKRSVFLPAWGKGQNIRTYK